MTHRIRRLVDRQTENVRDSHETDKRYTNWIKERKIQEFYVVLHNDSESSSATKDNLLRNMTPTKALQKNA